MATIADNLKDDESECDPDAFDPLCTSRGILFGIVLALPIWVLITAACCS